MLIKSPPDIRNSEITPKHVYLNRRTFLASLPVGLQAERNCPESIQHERETDTVQ